MITIDKAQEAYDNLLPEELDEEWCACGLAMGVPEDEEEFTCDACLEQEWQRNFRIRKGK